MKHEQEIRERLSQMGFVPENLTPEDLKQLDEEIEIEHQGGTVEDGVLEYLDPFSPDYIHEQTFELTKFKDEVLERLAERRLTLDDITPEELRNLQDEIEKIHSGFFVLDGVLFNIPIFSRQYFRQYKHGRKMMLECAKRRYEYLDIGDNNLGVLNSLYENDDQEAIVAFFEKFE